MSQTAHNFTPSGEGFGNILLVGSPGGDKEIMVQSEQTSNKKKFFTMGKDSHNVNEKKLRDKSRDEQTKGEIWKMNNPR